MIERLVITVWYINVTLFFLNTALRNFFIKHETSMEKRIVVLYENLIYLKKKN